MSDRISLHATDPGDVDPGDYALTVEACGPGGTVRRFAGLTPISASGVSSIVAGTGIAVDDTDPANPVVSATGGGGGGGGASLLASATYNPAAVTSISTSSTAFVDVNAGLAVTFTAPAGGSVLVTMSAPGGVSTSTAAGYWNLRDAAGDVAGTNRLASSSGAFDTRTVLILVTGLTAGASYTWKWGHRIHSASFSEIIAVGGVNGPATMLVQSI